jgi:glycerophosphoryl diester phosphodiesterase
MTDRNKILLFILVGLGLLFNRCDKEENYDIKNLNHNVIMILGHAGMGDLYKYPNNTLEAIEPVIGIGADGTEMDVQMTKDSVLILFHDETLDGRTRCDGFGAPYDYKWSEIKDCYYNTLVENIPIYSADEVFSQLPNLNDLYFSFDCKLNSELAYNESYRRQFLGAIKRLCEKYQMSDNVFIEGDLGFLLIAKEMGLRNKGFVIGSSVDAASENHIFGIGTTPDTPAEEINYAHSKGLYVMMWGLKSDTGNKKAIKLNPDIVQTDKPIPILMLFDRFNFGYHIP